MAKFDPVAAQRRQVLARNLRRLMKAATITQVQIAQICSVTQQNVSGWVRASRPIPETHQERLSKVFGWEVGEFLK